MYKYTCGQCKYNTNYKSQWNKHIDTEKHKTGKRKIRSDKKDPPKCTICNHTSTDITNLKLHILNKHSTIEEKQNKFKYCDFGSFSKRLYDRHLKTKKHKHIQNILNKKE